MIFLKKCDGGHYESKYNLIEQEAFHWLMLRLKVLSDSIKND